MKKITEKEALLILNHSLAQAKGLFLEKDFKNAAKLYLNVAKLVHSWERAVIPTIQPKQKPKEQPKELPPQPPQEEIKK